jgi:alpha-amylase/alpha-mannosidase (GH57 family)
MTEPTLLVIHGHFYQPPREDPWTGEVPEQPSAAPFHDWNERITAECYRPNGWVSIPGADEADQVVSTYDHLSFNVGPTLLSWLEDHHPDVYERILDADRRTGRAIAQGYGHAILPLCNERDLRTQVRWGQADFAHRFGRPATGMWLPETAVSDAVLAVLAEEGIGLTILAPKQIAGVRPLTGGDWAAHGDDDPDDPAAPLDVSRPIRWRHPTRPDLGVHLIVYDGALAHALAFSEPTSIRMIDTVVDHAGSTGGLVAAATDGETFGHHHKGAEVELARALVVEAPSRGIAVPSLTELLAARPPTHEARVRTSAWSCAHGVGRWKEDCGCSTGGADGESQAWRAPLREALDLLRDWGIGVVDERGPALLRDPWAARDAYVDVLIRARSWDDFAAAHVVREPAAARSLLEAQRHALLMYTSCAWFFHDLAGIETVQILRYAARAMDHYRDLGEEPPLEAFLTVLEQAVSNDPEVGDGRRLWHEQVLPAPSVLPGA